MKSGLAAQLNCYFYALLTRYQQLKQLGVDYKSNFSVVGSSNEEPIYKIPPARGRFMDKVFPDLEKYTWFWGPRSPAVFGNNFDSRDTEAIEVTDEFAQKLINIMSADLQIMTETYVREKRKQDDDRAIKQEAEELNRKLLSKQGEFPPVEKMQVSHGGEDCALSGSGDPRLPLSMAVSQGNESSRTREMIEKHIGGH